MNRYIMHMDAKDLNKELQNNLWDNPESTLGIKFGHTQDLHEGKTNSELLKRLVCEGKTAISSFTDYDTMMDSIVNATVYHSKEIVNWLQTGRNECKNPSDYGTLTIISDIDGDPIGHGFRQNLHEYETPIVKVVLERDLSDKAPYGFVLKTAYADITHPDARETGLIFTKQQIADENIIDFTSKTQETVFCLMGEFPGISIKATTDRNHEEQITVRMKDKSGYYAAFIKDHMIHCFVQKDVFRKSLCLQELPENMRNAAIHTQKTLRQVSLSYTNPFSKQEIKDHSPNKVPQKSEKGWER